MATDAITLRIDVLEQKMLGALGKIQGRMEQTKRKTEGWNKGLATARNLAAGIGGAFGFGVILSGLSKAISLHDQWIQKLRATGEQAAKTGKDVLALALMQEQGKAGDVARKMAAAAPSWSPGKAWSVGQQLQAQLGSATAGIKGLQAAHRLGLTGVTPEAAGGAVSLGMAVGLPAGVAARAPYAAGEESSLSPQELSEGGQRSLGVYRDPILGYSVMAEMSKFKKEPGMMGTYAKMARQSLMDPGKADMWRGMGVKDQSFFGRLRALKAGGYESEEALTNLGFAEKRGREAVGYLLRDIGSLEQKYSAIQRGAQTPGLLIRKRAAAESDPTVGPQIRHERVVETAKSTLQREKAIPSTPAAQITQSAGRQAQLEQLTRGIALHRMGVPDVPEEGYGAIGAWWARRMNIMRTPKRYFTDIEGSHSAATERWYEAEYARAYRQLRVAEDLQRAAKNLYNSTRENR